MNSHKKVGVISLAVGAALVSRAPFAQETADSAVTSALEEVVVTARMRSESLQQIPLAETAFSSQQIEDARIDQVGDFINMTPNMSVALSQSAGVSFITIRGIPQVRNGEPPVAVVTDGVLQISERQFTRELFDIDSIEVVRGPQGALYGRNAIGGAVIVNTRQPTDEWEGYVRAGYGKGDDAMGQASVSGPVVADQLYVRLGARYQDREGYFDNINLGVKADPYEDLTVSGLLKWVVNDQFSAALNVSHSETDAGSVNFRYQPAILTADGTSLDTSLPFPFDFSVNDANLVDRRFNQTNVGDNERDISEASIKLDYSAGFGTFTSISSYNDVMEYVSGDQFPYTGALTQFYFGGAFVADGGQTQFATVDAWSQEFRLTSRDDQRFRWMTGVYYLETDRFISTTTSDDRGNGLLRIERDPFFGDPRNPTLSFLADDNKNEAWAVFGNVAYDVTDQLEASVALRYDEDKRRQFVDERNTSGQPGAINEKTFDKLQPKVSLKYQATDDALFYGSWGVGFRSGQFNQNGVRQAAALIGLQGVDDFTPAETATTTEVGFKTELLDRRLRLNGSLYYTKDENPAYFVFIGSIGAQVLVPINEVTLRGGEIEAVARLADGLDAYASFGYTDSEIERYAVNPAVVGNRAPYVPDTTINVGLQYRRALSSYLGLLLRADYEQRGDQYWDTENTTARDPLNLVNARLGFEDPRGRWSLIGSVENLTDVVYNSEFVAGGFAHPAPPRIWNVDFRYNF
jgi:iron complex outermembrane receptor protein